MWKLRLKPEKKGFGRLEGPKKKIFNAGTGEVRHAGGFGGNEAGMEKLQDRRTMFAPTRTGRAMKGILCLRARGAGDGPRWQKEVRGRKKDFRRKRS